MPPSANWATVTSQLQPLQMSPGIIMSSHMVCLRDAECHLRLRLHDIRDGTLLKVRIWLQLHPSVLAASARDGQTADLVTFMFSAALYSAPRELLELRQRKMDDRKMQGLPSGRQKRTTPYT